MLATVKRQTANGFERLGLHENCNLSIIQSRICLRGPKYGFIADAQLEKVSCAFDDIGLFLLILDVLRKSGPDKYVEEKWTVSMIREAGI